MDLDDAVPAPSAPTRDSKEKETVKVVVRCRPFSTKETNEGRKSIITIDTQAGAVGIRCPENDQMKSFTFDSAYDETTTQRQFYDESGYPLVESIFEGYNGTIFAYGQTGCGKTHTMQGRDNPPELRGVIPHSFDHIFENINSDPSKEYMVRASYLEIYNEEIRDLLGDDQKKKLDLKEGVDGSVYVKDLIEVVVSDVDSINKVMSKGFKNRTVGATLMNEGSSRSHSIFTVVVEMSEKVGGQEHFKAGKLNLVDLAGSERQSKTGATGNRLKEGCKINLSLSALGNVISALVDGKGKHIPYRDSKLTRLLQDSLGGNTKTLMVAAISPADYNYDETLSTLRYANRAKNIKNKPMVNEDPKDAKLREYKEEIERLKKMLEVQSRGSSVGGTLSGVSTPTRPFSPPTVNTEVDVQVAKEREENLRYQQEAAEMMERAKRMMEEAKTLQEQQAKQQHGQPPSPRAPSEPPSPQQQQMEEKLQQQQLQNHVPYPDVTRVVAPDTINSPKPGSAGRPASLPPIGSVTSPRAADPVKVQPLPRQTEPSPATDTPLVLAPPVEDPAIAKALREAAQVDAQAKVMMAKAEQLIREAEKRAKEPPKVKIVKEVVVKEVIPDDHIKEKAELHELNAAILTQKHQIGKELERTQQAMESYLREKEELQNKLRKIESQILGGSSSRHAVEGNTQLNSEIALLKQQVEYRRAQIKLKEKAKKAAQYEAAQKTLTLEKQMIEEELKNAQEAVQANLAAAKKKESKYRARLEAARQEVIDLNNEFERERENLLDTIREQTKESKLLEQLVELFLPQNELVKVWERAVWIEDKEEWQLPKIKPRSDFQKIKLPALGGGLGSPATIESGGGEVVSDDEINPAGAASVRSVGSSASAKRPKIKQGQSKPPPVVGKSDSGASPSFYSARAGEIGSAPLLPNQAPPSTHRLLSPGSTRLPSTVRPPRTLSKEDEMEPQEPEQPISKPNRSTKSRDETKKRKSSKDYGKGSSEKNAASSPQNTSQEPSNGTPERFFTVEDDQLAPLNGESYQPRDRLQSRQGSRQGPRSHDRQGGLHSNTSSRSSLGEFDAPLPVVPTDNHHTGVLLAEKPPIGSRGGGSRNGGSGGRKHRTREHRSNSNASSGAVPGLGDVETADDLGEESEANLHGESSPEASLIKKTTHKHKKKNKKDKEHSHSHHHSDENDLLNDLGEGFFLPRATRPSFPSTENQDR